jgi:hypothetical protein
MELWHGKLLPFDIKAVTLKGLDCASGRNMSEWERKRVTTRDAEIYVSVASHMEIQRNFTEFSLSDCACIDFFFASQSIKHEWD